jgi:hypothetical protein
MGTGPRGKVGKAFFSEEKKQKTFPTGAAANPSATRGASAASEAQVFWFFFSKKNSLP